MSSYNYSTSNYKDKMVAWPFYLYNGNPYTGKMASLYIELIHRSSYTNIYDVFTHNLSSYEGH